MRITYRYGSLFLCSLLMVLLAGCVFDFSPDGRRVVFMNPGHSNELAILNIDGTGYQVVPDSKSGGGPMWSPDGKYILFSKESPDLTLCLYDVASRKVRRFTSDTHRLDSFYSFVWRPDSRQFAVFCTKKRGKRYEDMREIIWVRLPQLDVVRRVPLRVKEKHFFIEQITWLPRTEDVAFIGQVRNKSNIYRIESGKLKQITTTGDVTALGLSADRRKLIWARQGQNQKEFSISLFTYDLTSRSIGRLPFPRHISLPSAHPKHELYSYGLIFAPKGSHLLAVATFNTGTKDEFDKPQRYNVCYSMKIDGSDVHPVYRNKPDVDVLWGPLRLWPAWSPNEQRILIGSVSTEDHRSEAKWMLFIYNAAGRRSRRLWPPVSPKP